MPEKAEEENKEDDHSVIYAEVVEIALHSSSGFAERVRASEGGEIEKFAPRAARGEESISGSGGIGGDEGGWDGCGGNRSEGGARRRRH